MQLTDSWRRALAGLALAFVTVRALAIDVAIVDRPSSDSDRRRDYTTVLLTAVLERTRPEFGPYRIELAERPMERPRLLQEMLAGRHVNVASNPIDAEWLAQLKSVPVPVDLGVHCWRLLLLNASNQPRIRQLAAAGQLQQASAGVGSYWALRQILSGQGYRTVAGTSYEGLFLMLRAGRFDYFPRPITEIFPEFEHYHASFPQLAIDESVVLYTRLPALFFVSPREERLYRRINSGMESMLRDGSLERLMLAFYRSDLMRAQLCGRIRIELPNPRLAPALQARQELWFDPFDPRHGLCPAGHAAPSR